MPDLPIQGKLRIRAENYERDIAFVRPRVGELSNAVQRSVPGYDFLKYWYVDFAATPEQWAELAPELDRRNVLVTLFESPALIGDDAPEEPQPTEEVAPAPRSPYRWVPWAAFALIPISLALAFFVPDWAIAFVCAAGLALIATLLLGVFVSLQEV
jgi:hypothetical protein